MTRQRHFGATLQRAELSWLSEEVAEVPVSRLPRGRARHTMFGLTKLLPCLPTNIKHVYKTFLLLTQATN